MRCVTSSPFRPSQRLRIAADFTALLEGGYRYNDSRFVIYYRQNTAQFARLGLAVGKRVARKATCRNQLKRLLRETFRMLGHQLPPLDIFVLLKPNAALVAKHELRAGITRAFASLKADQSRHTPSSKK